MNQAADTVSNLGAFVMLTVYWILLIMWDTVFPPHDSSRPAPVVSENMDGVTAAHIPAPSTATRLLRQVDPSFDEAAFLISASCTYETVLQAYAKGETGTLEPLVGEAVLQVFDHAAAMRRERGETLELALIALKAAEIVHAAVEGTAAEISVRFVSDLISVSRSLQGEVVAGDPQRILRTEDLWTFAHDPKIDATGWRLVATESW